MMITILVAVKFTFLYCIIYIYNFTHNDAARERTRINIIIAAHAVLKKRLSVANFIYFKHVSTFRVNEGWYHQNSVRWTSLSVL